MMDEATGHAEPVRRAARTRIEATPPGDAHAGALLLTTPTTPKEILPGFFSTIVNGAEQDKINAIRNVKAALDNPHGAGLPDTVTLNNVVLRTKDVWMKPSTEALATLVKIKQNYERGIRASRTQTLGGNNYEILSFGIDGKTITQAVMAGVFNAVANEPPQFREVLFKTFLTWAANPTFQRHYFGPDTEYGQVDFARVREPRTKAGRAVKKVQGAPGEGLNKVRAQLLREQAWEQGVINRGKEKARGAWQGARTGGGRVAQGLGRVKEVAGRGIRGVGRAGRFAASTPGRVLHGAGEAIGPRVRGAGDGIGRGLHGLVGIPGRVGEFTFGRFLRHPAEPAGATGEPPPPAPPAPVIEPAAAPPPNVEPVTAELEEEAATPEVSRVSGVGFAEDANTHFRPSMEDAHTMVENFGGRANQTFAAIYDGHMGREVADFVGNILHENVLAQLNRGLNPAEALKEAYLATDSQVLELPTNAGSTAVSALVVGDRLYVANIGDARAVLNRNGIALRLSKDHKASAFEERGRIERAGGRILNNRVEGQLAVARSFGDKSLKRSVIADPYISETMLGAQDASLILACDGLWDVLSDQEAVQLIRDEEDPEVAAEKLKNAALERGSTDNISVYVLKLR